MKLKLLIGEFLFLFVIIIIIIIIIIILFFIFICILFLFLLLLIGSKVLGMLERGEDLRGAVWDKSEVEIIIGFYFYLLLIYF